MGWATGEEWSEGLRVCGEREAIGGTATWGTLAAGLGSSGQVNATSWGRGRDRRALRQPGAAPGPWAGVGVSGSDSGSARVHCLG